MPKISNSLIYKGQKLQLLFYFNENTFFFLLIFVAAAAYFFRKRKCNLLNLFCNDLPSVFILYIRSRQKIGSLRLLLHLQERRPQKGQK